MDERKKGWIGLNLVDTLGPVRIRNLLKRFKEPKKVFNATISELLEIPGISRNVAERIKDFSVARLEKELSLMEEMGLSVITLEDQDYPANLKLIYAPPAVLYIQGEIKAKDRLAIAVVGTRRCSYYGRKTANSLSYELVNRGFTIVSGMARGIDTEVHKGALKAGGRTIAVLGSGLARIYPGENKNLSKEIAQSGAVISEFPLLTSPERGNFPRRNRIISGLSLGLVVIEAPNKSGALITADFALEQGREVFAIPGNVDQPTSSGTLHLIKQGAKLVTQVDDIIEELGALINLLPKKKEEQGKKRISGGLGLKEREQEIYQLLTISPRHIDEIIKESNFPASVALSALMTLELKGLVKQLPGKFYVLA
ncbi:MAG: DNA-protecting protein DprA [bacterium (Candidatus Ratteibacteria) CG_4_10_14_3_um_filter_41_18]|uniref:DNA-protecting protein DprA n=4 Tax=Candidatus Ratteibacteria TaxID=2979319 RepID=A0A2M7E6I4_9BACT|nr:MAG: DNA protecting protein DprA [Candidatus Omnitrophica bacterium CG1_02_41_171]PIV63347.1 MAG: DNA-protecting protein DprA [bacterium (Candidatus Ratteibacteria) CG01_land_8_20_14_3_00_40_19]PIW33807.1 MAG: DNA-protecting protein DprA [bacterium (Candidatus Ratteibacteria) CG15_BIG_FIL_POST_REV_8_21_14_020_41_12]PIW74498.1 MAG: DNA-protecting protein DprA [bacterium (Candidatus Ratteibacteria) CG_4_8_14_3_um_filter_41_36]PIX77914.1 MAG: DNA-protecting protein DprA [bacterium (Candidatus R